MSTKLKILHLEDAHSDAELVNYKLKKSKLEYEMLVADTRDKFIKELKDFLPDIILADNSLPAFDSHEALAALNETGFKIPFILVTGTMPDEAAADLIKKGADDYILKDRLSRLPEAILNALEKYRLKKAQQIIMDELVKSESRLKQTQAISNLGSWDLDYSTGIAIWSDEQLKIYGLLPGNNQQSFEAWISYIHPDDIENVLQKTNDTKSTFSNADYFHRIVRRDGSVRHVYSQIRSKVDNTGTLTGLHGVIQDMTDIKNSEIALKESQSNLLAIFENTSDGFILADSRGIIKAFNTKAKDRTRLNTDQELTTGKSILDFLPDSKKEMYRDNIAKVLSGEILQYDFAYNRKSGETKWFSFTVNPVYNAEQIEGFSIASTDITERKKVEQQLKDSELFNKGILASLSSHIAVIDHKGDIIAVNAAWDDFAKNNGVYSLGGVSTGSNYFEVCQRSMALGNTMAGETLQGIQSVFNNEVKIFELEYPCHSLTEQRWFVLSVTGFGEDNSKVVISHQNITQRKITEDQLIKSELRLKDAQAVAKIGSWETDLKTFDVTWSDETHHIFKTDPNRFQATHSAFLSFIHPDDRNKVNTAFENSLRSQTVNSIDHRIIATNGVVKHVTENWKIFQDGEGNAVRAIGSCQDITERKIAEQERNSLQSTLENSLNEIYICDIESLSFSYVNKGALLNLGYSEQEIKALTPLALKPEFTAAAYNELVAPLLNNEKEKIVFFTHHKRKDESLYPVEVHLQLVTEGNNKRFLAIVLDITERKIAEEKVIKLNEAVAKSEKFFKGVIESSDDMITIIAPTGETIYASPAVSKKFGYSNEETLKLNIADIVHPDDALIMHEFITKIMMHPGVPMQCPLIRDRKKDGTYMWVDGTLTNFLETEGINAIVANFRDVSDKKKLETLLDKSNRLAAIGSWEIDVIKGTVFWSDITKEIREADADFSPDLTNGMQLFQEGYHRNTITKRVKDCIEKGVPWDDELQIITQKGNLKWIRTIGEAEVIDGKCVKVYGSFQDINERKKSELELLKIYKEKNSILESIGDGFYSVDKNWTVTYWNNQAEKMTGKLRNDVIGKELWQVYPDMVGTPSYTSYLKAVEENSIQSFELYSDADSTWIDFSIYPSPSGISVYFRDVTKRKLAEQQIKSEKRLLRTLIDNIPDAIYFKDKMGRKLVSNKFDYTLTGAEKEEEVLGKTDLELLTQNAATTGYQHDMEILSTGEPLTNFEERFILKNGNPVWLLTTKLALRNDNNEISGMMGIGRDITARKLAEEKLLAVNIELEKFVKQLVLSNTQLEQFAYVASHDLQEPLRMVTSFLTLIEKRYGQMLDEKGKQYIHFAVDGAGRMRQMILDLLQFSRAGKTEDKLEEVDLNEVIQEILLLYNSQIQESNAVIKASVLPVLRTSRTAVRQVFQNLISNSLKYRKPNTVVEINISFQPTESHWEFAVADNGIGIDPRFFEKIFIIFQRLHNKDQYSGTGIGLAITKKIVENLGGKIRVRSAEGDGTTFYFTLVKRPA
ncbi:MAG: PAS domain S-box protein [Chitinophagaceae bacterium]